MSATATAAITAFVKDAARRCGRGAVRGAVIALTRQTVTDISSVAIAAV